MKTVVSALAIGAGILWATVAAAGQQDFRLLNNTGYVVEEVYVSAVNTASWEEDIMGKDVLAAGDHVDISFSSAEDQCMWDLMAVYDDGEEAVWHNLNLCSISQVTLFYNAGDGSTHAVVE